MYKTYGQPGFTRWTRFAVIVCATLIALGDEPYIQPEPEGGALKAQTRGRAMVQISKISIHKVDRGKCSVTVTLHAPTGLRAGNNLFDTSNLPNAISYTEPGDCLVRSVRNRRRKFESFGVYEIWSNELSLILLKFDSAMFNEQENIGKAIDELLMCVADCYSSFELLAQEPLDWMAEQPADEQAAGGLYSLLYGVATFVLTGSIMFVTMISAKMASPSPDDVALTTVGFFPAVMWWIAVGGGLSFLVALLTNRSN